MDKSSSRSDNHRDDNHTYNYLKPNQIEMIEEALLSLGESGEIRLIVEKGRLRFLITQKSFDTQIDD